MAAKQDTTYLLQVNSKNNESIKDVLVSVVDDVQQCVVEQYMVRREANDKLAMHTLSGLQNGVVFKKATVVQRKRVDERNKMLMVFVSEDDSLADEFHFRVYSEGACLDCAMHPMPPRAHTAKR